MATHLIGMSNLGSSYRRSIQPYSVTMKSLPIYEAYLPLVVGEAKSAIAEYSYCGVLYKNALATLQKKFGQPHAVVGAHLDKLSSFPPLKMHNSENVISFSSTISGLVAVFKSLSFNDDLKSVNLLNQAVSKLPPNLKEAWPMQTVSRQWHRPSLLDFNEWLKEKAEGHERLKQLILRLSLRNQ